MTHGHSLPSVLVNSYGAHVGGIVRTHDELVGVLSERARVWVASEPVGARRHPRATTVSSQTESRLRSMLVDLVAAYRRRLRVDVRIDVAPAFRPHTSARRHVVIVNDMNFLTPEVHRISGKQRVYRHLLHRWTLRHADRIVAISESTRLEVVGFLPRVAHKTSVLTLPVTHLAGRGRPRRDGGPDAAPVGAGGRIRLLSFGHARNKGVDRLLDLLAQRPDIDLTVICSAVHWTTYWSDQAERLGVADRVVVRTRPDDAELVDLYRTCDAFCMLSTYEGYGFPVAEALLLATPTLVSDIPVLRATSRGFATVVPDGDPQTLSDLVDATVACDARHWDEAGQAFASWTWDAFADELMGELA